MVSTYTPNLRLAEQADGDNPNTWGDILNSQVIQLLEDALTKVQNIDCTGVIDVNIANTVVNGGADQARSAVLELTGLIGNAINLILPSVQKMYLIRAAQTGGFNITVKPVGSSGGIVFSSGQVQLIYTNGTNIYSLGSGSLLAANNLTDLGNLATAQMTLQISAVAGLSVGTAANNLVQLDGFAKLPALDGSQLTNVVAVPTGSGMDYWGQTAPTGYLFAYGQAVSRTTYANLFTAISTTFGIGDGSTTFNLPDKRGRASFGKDDMGGTPAGRLTGSVTGSITGTGLGNTGGEEGHALTSDENGPHSHTTIGSSGTNVPPAILFYLASGNLSGTATTGSSGSGTRHNTVPPGIICNYIIKT